MTIQELRAKRLSDAIAASGYTFEELGKKITSASKSSIQRYASGETKKIPIDFLEEIATLLNVDAKYLIGWDEEELAPTNDDDDELNKLYDFIKQFDFDKSQLDSIRNFVRFTAEDTTKE